MQWLIAQGARRLVAAALFGVVVTLELLGVLPVDLAGLIRDVLRPFVSN